MKSYEEKVHEQINQYASVADIHDLPDIYHLWSNKFVATGIQAVFGVKGVAPIYVLGFEAAAAKATGIPRFLSLGCGDGSLEMDIARRLKTRGMHEFLFVCYDLSDMLIERFRAALPADLKDCFALRVGDLNAQSFETRFDAIMAHHSLHHMVELERIFALAWQNLSDHGVFVTMDMIGRNGHVRWPETRLFVDYFWPFLTQRQRFNQQLRRLEPRLIDHDCSSEAFEGVRAQDILPLILAQGFKAWKFFAAGGVIDVFVDRSFGHNFSNANADDVFLINKIASLNELLLDAGLVKPTVMYAYFVKDAVEPIYYRNRTAASAVRDTTADPIWLAAALEDFTRIAVDPGFAFRATEGETPSLPPARKRLAPLRRIAAALGLPLSREKRV